MTPAPGHAAAPATTAGQTMPKDTAAALQQALVADQAAIWAYGLVAAYDGGDATTIDGISTAHLMRRDATAGRLSAGGVTPVQPAAAYSVPAPVTDAKSAQALAIKVETDCADAWYAVIGSTDDAELRGVALAALSDSAVRMANWKTTAGVNPTTVPFPGRPG